MYKEEIMGSVTQKGPLWPESMSYHFGMTPTYLIFFKLYFILFFFFLKVGVRARPSFGMTTTQDIRELFA